MKSSMPCHTAFVGLFATLAATSLPAKAADTDPKPIVAALQPCVERHSLAGAVTLGADKDKVLASKQWVLPTRRRKPVRPDALPDRLAVKPSPARHDDPRVTAGEGR